MSAEPGLILVPYGVDPLRLLAERLLDRQPVVPLDLSRHVVLLPRGGAAARFRSILLETSLARGQAALLPPWIGTFAAWAERHAHADGRYLTYAARELVLLDALDAYPELKARFGIWPLVDSLLALFDEFAVNLGPPSGTREQFAQSLRAGYGARTPLPPLDAEAERVYTLWTAWVRHLREQRLSDPAWRSRAGLERSLDQLPRQTHVYLAGVADLTDAEIDWACTLHAREQLTLVLHGQVGAHRHHPDYALTTLLQRLKINAPVAGPTDEFTRWLDATFALGDTVLSTRARDFAAAHPRSPARGRMSLFEAADLEYEARAIDLQVRRWRIEGRSHIGIVTNDRKLARRVRALLERANVRLRDSGGWALSTTSAATALIRWLECIEQNFAHAPLLDLLKSPFVTLGFERAELTPMVRDLERYVVRQLGVLGDVNAYRAGVARAQRAAALSGRTFVDPGALLDRLVEAAAPLHALLYRGLQSSAEYLEALSRSLASLGLLSTYQSDQAGIELLASLEQLSRELADHSRRMDWPQFHRWLQRDMERRRLRSAIAGTEVELMDLAESRCYRFDGLIVGGCTRDHLPGGSAASPFFNDAARVHLGLPGMEQRRAIDLYDFRRVVEAAPNVMLTYRRADREDALVPSPWIERINAFHRIAYGTGLDDDGLGALLQNPATLLTRREAPLPLAQHMPAPRLPDALVPTTLTAGAAQRLVDCPYQFYAADALGLAPLQSAHEEIDKSDYGQRVHRILQAFHVGISGLPGPWDAPVTESTRAAAEAMLREISRAVFAADLTRRFGARGWLYRWEAVIPAYLDWQQQRARANWRFEAAELRIQRSLTDDAALTLSGRIDRVDRAPIGISLIDYKTGQLPDVGGVTAGEQVQLSFYTLLVDEPVYETLYLGLHDDGIDDLRIEGEALTSVRNALRDRLVTLFDEIRQGAALPAWGDDATCAYCSMEGVCRKQLWAPEDESEATKKAALRPPFI